MSDARSEALGWLSTFEAACRGQDFAAGRRLFAPDAVAFGTYATAVHGLDNIEREQWRQIWPRIRGFRFEGDPAVAGAGDSAWIAATWSSEATGPDGQPFTRHGPGHLQPRPAGRPVAGRPQPRLPAAYPVGECPRAAVNLHGCDDRRPRRP